jgi:hypothetical protein
MAKPEMATPTVAQSAIAFFEITVMPFGCDA